MRIGGGAIRTRADDIVITDPDKARGRQDIVKACPYKAIVWNEEPQLPRSGSSMLICSARVGPARVVNSRPYRCLRDGQARWHCDVRTNHPVSQPVVREILRKGAVSVSTLLVSSITHRSIGPHTPNQSMDISLDLDDDLPLSTSLR